jgi:hypothetical protein
VGTIVLVMVPTIDIPLLKPTVAASTGRQLVFSSEKYPMPPVR